MRPLHAGQGGEGMPAVSRTLSSSSSSSSSSSGASACGAMTKRSRLDAANAPATAPTSGSSGTCCTTTTTKNTNSSGGSKTTSKKKDQEAWWRCGEALKWWWTLPPERLQLARARAVQGRRLHTDAQMAGSVPANARASAMRSMAWLGPIVVGATDRGDGDLVVWRLAGKGSTGVVESLPIPEGASSPHRVVVCAHASPHSHTQFCVAGRNGVSWWDANRLHQVTQSEAMDAEEHGTEMASMAREGDVSSDLSLGCAWGGNGVVTFVDARSPRTSCASVVVVSSSVRRARPTSDFSCARFFGQSTKRVAVLAGDSVALVDLRFAGGHDGHDGLEGSRLPRGIVFEPMRVVGHPQTSTWSSTQRCMLPGFARHRHGVAALTTFADEDSIVTGGWDEGYRVWSMSRAQVIGSFASGLGKFAPIASRVESSASSSPERMSFFGFCAKEGRIVSWPAVPKTLDEGGHPRPLHVFRRPEYHSQEACGALLGEDSCDGLMAADVAGGLTTWLY